MAKTYNTIPSVATGDLLTATAWNTQATNVNNYRVPPICRVYRAAALNQTANGAAQTIAFDTESVDTDAMHDTVTNTTRITFNTAGVYMVGGSVAFTPNSTGVRAAKITVNGTTDIAYADQQSAAAAASAIHVVTSYSFAANDYIELGGYQNSGGNLAYFVTYQSVNFWATWVGQVS